VNERDDQRDTLDLGEVRCATCPLGQASGAGRGQFCPFITREVGRGEVLCRAGEPAGYVWMVKKGAVGLGLAQGDLDRLDTIRLPGTFIGLECLVQETYLATARTVARSTLCGATREGFRRWVRGSDERLALVLRAALGDPILAGLSALDVDAAPDPEPDDPGGILS
jgi:hypothetical protein